jgi:hypothetical protein
MERSYEQGSDLELMAQAAENLSEAGSEEYWAALLESAPYLFPRSFPLLPITRP